MKAWLASRTLRFGALLFALVLVGALLSAENLPLGKSHDVTLREWVK